MDLTYKQYIAHSEDDRFNLYEVVEYTCRIHDSKDGHKFGDVYTKEVNIGYGYRYEGLIAKIARLELAADKQTYKLHEYIAMFQAIVKTITLT